MISYILLYALVTGAAFGAFGYLQVRTSYYKGSGAQQIRKVALWVVAGVFMGGIGAYLRMQEFHFLGEALR